MKRLYIFCEGQTEESFVGNLLAPHFEARKVDTIPLILPSKVGSASRRHKGGWTDYRKAKQFINITMRQLHADDTWFTTMLDLYAIPSDFPEINEISGLSAESRVAVLEQAFRKDICTDKLWRFTTYLQLHEYEALLLVKPDAFLSFYPNRGNAISALRKEIGGLAPEAINDGPDTAPSKRIIRYLPEYEKVLAGTLVAIEIGLSHLRSRCEHFNSWINELEKNTK